MHVEKTKRLIIWNGGIICRFVVVGGDDSEVLYGSRTGLQMVWQSAESQCSGGDGKWSPPGTSTKRTEWMNKASRNSYNFDGKCQRWPATSDRRQAQDALKNNLISQRMQVF